MVTVDRECYCNGAHVDFALHARGTFSHCCVPHTALSCSRTASTCTLALHARHLLTPLCTTHGTLLHPHAPRCTLPHCTLALHVRHPLSSHTVVYHTRHFPAPARTAPPYHTSCGPPAHSSSPTRLHMPRSPRHPSTNLRPHPTSYDRTLHDPPPPPSFLHDHFIVPS